MQLYFAVHSDAQKYFESQVVRDTAFYRPHTGGFELYFRETLKRARGLKFFIALFTALRGVVSRVKYSYRCKVLDPNPKLLAAVLFLLRFKVTSLN